MVLFFKPPAMQAHGIYFESTAVYNERCKNNSDIVTEYKFIFA